MPRPRPTWPWPFASAWSTAATLSRRSTTAIPTGYAKAVACGHLPVIMAGGPKTNDELAIFRQLHDAMTHGASGAAIGRRVWGSQRPADTLDAIRAIVIDGAHVDEAIAIYTQAKKGATPGVDNQKGE